MTTAAAPGKRTGERGAGRTTVPRARRTAVRDGVPARVRAGYAVGALASGTFTTLPGLLLLPYLTDTLGVGAALAGAAVLVPKLWAAALNPVLGGLGDGAASRRRLMLYGGAAMALACALMFAGVAHGTAGAWLGEAGFLLAASAFACFQAPYAALPADLAVRPADRVRLAAGRVAGLGVAALAVGAVGPALVSAGGPAAGYRWAGLFGGALIAVGTLGVALATRRPNTTPVSDTVPTRAGDTLRSGVSVSLRRGLDLVRGDRSFRALLGAGTAQALATGVLLAGVPYAARQVLGEPAFTGALVAAFVVPDLVTARWWVRLGARLGTHRAYALAGAVFTVGCLGFLVAPVVPSGFLLAAMALAGTGHAGQLVFLYGLLPDRLAADAARTGGRDHGVLSGLFATGETAGLALAPFAYGLVLAAFGYVSSGTGHAAHQTGAGRLGILVGLALLPLLATTAATLSLRGSRPPRAGSGTGGRD
ncbi:MFS transporter [Streptomyces sp. NPDC048362]|uniref:MFS transporter n=1 Tax=Streptomyces sp. NPDC048362 TaxID=3365539 RepID=UPI003721E2FA